MSFRGRLLAGILCAFSALFAQVSTSRLTGSIQDSSGAAVPAARVTARNEATGESRTATLDESGIYAFDALPTGLYTVDVEASGF